MRRKFCKDPNCRQWHKVGKYEDIRALNQGWHEVKSGDAWCPDHNPKEKS